jgi:hypothetical protein
MLLRISKSIEGGFSTSPDCVVTLHKLSFYCITRVPLRQGQATAFP